MTMTADAIGNALSKLEAVVKDSHECEWTDELETLTSLAHASVASLTAERDRLRGIEAAASKIFSHFATVPCLLELLGEYDGDACGCMACASQKWLARSALPSQGSDDAALLDEAEKLGVAWTTEAQFARIVALARLGVAGQQDTARLDFLATQLRGDLEGDVTLTCSDSPPMRTINIYLGHSVVPAGVGTTLSEAIDTLRASQERCDRAMSAEQIDTVAVVPSALLAALAEWAKAYDALVQTDKRREADHSGEAARQWVADRSVLDQRSAALAALIPTQETDI